MTFQYLNPKETERGEEGEGVVSTEESVSNAKRASPASPSDNLPGLFSHGVYIHPLATFRCYAVYSCIFSPPMWVPRGQRPGLDPPTICNILRGALQMFEQTHHMEFYKI